MAEVLGDLIDGSSVGGGTFDLGSATFDMTRVVTGQLDAYVEPGPLMVSEVPGMREEFERVGGGAVLNNSPYDLAAAALCLDEAGAVVTDAAGGSLRDRPLLGSGRGVPDVVHRLRQRGAAPQARRVGRRGHRATARAVGLATRAAPARAGRSCSLPRRAHEVALGQRSLADYTHICGRGLIDEIRELAEPLEGKRILHVNATAFGGGVSEILYTLVPLMNDVGLDTHWQVILGREEFFNVSKLMHNSLQGDEQSISDEQWEVFEAYNAMNAQSLDGDWDVIIIHDPQPAGPARRTRPSAPRTGSGAATSTSRRRTPRRSSACCPCCATTTPRSGTCSSTCPADLDGAGRGEHRARRRSTRSRRRTWRSRPTTPPSSASSSGSTSSAR